MDTVGSPIYVDDATKHQVYKLHKTSPHQARKQLKSLRKWAAAYPCAQIHPRFLEVMLLRAKFDEQVARKRIDSYFHHLPHYKAHFCNLPGFEFAREQFEMSTAPHLTPIALERVTVLRMRAENVRDFSVDFERVLSVVLSVGLVAFHLDFCAGARFVFDMRGVEMRHLKRFSPWMAFRFVAVIQKMTRVRIAGVELVNAPGVVGFLMPLARLVLTRKLYGRITIHENLESLYENVPKDFLPAEYGGHLGQAETISAKWNQVIELHRPLLDKVIQLANQL